jgi:hypothetical protein
MSQIVRVNGDYGITTAEGGSIVLDTGEGIGEVRVTGNLVVEGDTLTISAEDLNILDNVLVLNYGETGPGVSLNYSGIQVERGSDGGTPVDSALFVFDESSLSWVITAGTLPSDLNYTNSNLRLRRIYTDSDTDRGDLTLLGGTVGIVKTTTSNYTNRILERDAEDPTSADNILTNKGYVDYAIQSNPTRRIVSGNSVVIVSDYDEGDTNYAGDPITQTRIEVVTEDTISAIFFKDRVELGREGQGLRFERTTITTELTNENIIIDPAGDGRLEITTALQLNSTRFTASDDPTLVPANLHYLYTGTENAGGTGIFFAKQMASDPTRDLVGEVISKNKALVFSMIF